MKKSLLFLLVIILASCGNKEKKSPEVFFAGEIVNPTSDYVVLLKGDEVIDSVALDENNRFSFTLDCVSKGLYHFNHAPEYQYVYLEAGDSLQIRLNTMDFDESLVFSGSETSAEVNNFLLDLFLSHEKEETDIYKKFFHLEPQEFSDHIEGLRKEKHSNLSKMASEMKLSSNAENVIQASIDFTYYKYKEEYPFKQKKSKGPKIFNELPANFYEYRQHISYSNPQLNYLRPYYDFMQTHIKNLSYVNCSNDCKSQKGEIRSHLHFNRHKLSVIDSLVDDSELKDNLFRNVAFNYLLMANDNEKNIETFISDFHLRSGNNRHIKEINALYQGIQNVQPKKTIPDVMVTNIKGEKISLRDISKGGKVVFYFWTGSDRGHFKNIIKRADYLSKTNKEYTFVGINIRTDEATWRGIVEKANLDIERQYIATDFEEITRSLIIHHLNRCVITDDTTIIDAFSDMYTASL